MTVDYNDIFAIQDSVAGAVIHGLKGQLSNEDKINEKEIEPKDPKAYELYLKAKAINPVVIGDYRRQVSYLKQSLDLDEEFAPAWAQLGFAYHRLGNFGVDLKTNAVNAESAFLQTLKINPTNRQVYGLLIQFYTDQNRLIEAYSYGNKGLHLYPNDSRIIGYLGYAVRYAGLLEESIRFTDKSVQLEFDSYEKTRLLNDIARGYFYLGDSELGRRKFDDLINFMKEEEIEIPSYLIFYDGMWDLYVNNNQSAYDKFDILMELDPTQIFSKYGQVYKNILQGNRSKALKIIDELNKIVIYDGEQYYRFIQFYAMLNMPEEAIEKMKGTLARGFYPYPYYQSDKFLDNIRSEPGFQEVLKQIRGRHIEFKTLFESTMDKSLLSEVSSN
jgi:tetratricopeptide (TPR) repeat protein